MKTQQVCMHFARKGDTIVTDNGRVLIIKEAIATRRTIKARDEQDGIWRCFTEAGVEIGELVKGVHRQTVIALYRKPSLLKRSRLNKKVQHFATVQGASFLFQQEAAEKEVLRLIALNDEIEAILKLARKVTYKQLIEKKVDENKIEAVALERDAYIQLLNDHELLSVWSRCDEFTSIGVDYTVESVNLGYARVIWDRNTYRVTPAQLEDNPHLITTMDPDPCFKAHAPGSMYIEQSNIVALYRVPETNEVKQAVFTVAELDFMIARP